MNRLAFGDDDQHAKRAMLVRRGVFESFEFGQMRLQFRTLEGGIRERAFDNVAVEYRRGDGVFVTEFTGEFARGLDAKIGLQMRHANFDRGEVLQRHACLLAKA